MHAQRYKTTHIIYCVCFQCDLAIRNLLWEVCWWLSSVPKLNLSLRMACINPLNKTAARVKQTRVRNRVHRWSFALFRPCRAREMLLAYGCDSARQSHRLIWSQKADRLWMLHLSPTRNSKYWTVEYISSLLSSAVMHISVCINKKVRIFFVFFSVS